MNSTEKQERTDPDPLDTLSGRIAYEVDMAADRAMRDMFPDLPRVFWTLHYGVLVGGFGGLHADGIAQVVERLGLVEAPREGDLPGYSRFAGSVDGIKVEIRGITDRDAWNAAYDELLRAPEKEGDSP